jgi:hypothetical protein
MPHDAFDPDEHSAQGLLGKLAQEDVGAGCWELDLTQRLLSMYEARGLLRDGRARPLYEACDACAECWAGDVPRPPAWRAEVSVPWIGSGYRESGICAIAINLNKYGPLGANWWIVRGHIHDRLGKDHGATSSSAWASIWSRSARVRKETGRSVARSTPGLRRGAGRTAPSSRPSSARRSPVSRLRPGRCGRTAHRGTSSRSWRSSALGSSSRSG